MSKLLPAAAGVAARRCVRRRAPVAAASLASSEPSAAALSPGFDAFLERCARLAPLGARVLVAGDAEAALRVLSQPLPQQGVLVVLPDDAAAARAAARRPAAPVLGNEAAVRFRAAPAGGLAGLPPYEGPFTGAFALFDAAAPLAELLAALAGLLVAGGHAVVVAPPPRIDAADHAADPWPCTLDELAALCAPLPLEALSVVGEGSSSSSSGAAAAPAPAPAGAPAALLVRVPPRYALPGGPVRLTAPVVRGFGRGGSQLGFPTANLDTGALHPPALAALRRGVHFGWAALDGGPPLACVLNVGVRPTVEGGGPGGALSVEAHLLDPVPPDFYGAKLDVLVLGFLRPERRFAGLQQLRERIAADCGAARAQLAAPEARAAGPRRAQRVTGGGVE